MGSLWLMITMTGGLVAPLEPHVLSAFGKYEPVLRAFGRHQEVLESFGRFEDVVDTFGNEGEV